MRERWVDVRKEMREKEERERGRKEVIFDWVIK